MTNDNVSDGNWFSKYVITCIVTLITIVFVLKKYGTVWKQRVFAWISDKSVPIMNAILQSNKKELFQTLHGMTSKDHELKNKGLLRILEIGVGSGANFKYYPKNCHLIVVDPNPFTKDYFERNKTQFPDVKIEQFYVGYAENMADIPESSVDAVVCSLVLCSVADTMKVLDEVHRVLVPGGKFFYMEHVWDKAGTTLNKLQRILSVSGIWPFVFENCRLDRNTDKIVECSKFSKVEQKRFYFNQDGFTFTQRMSMYFPKSMLMGTATK